MANEEHKEIFISHQAALLLNVKHDTVVEWIEQGFLKATSSSRGCFRIKRRDLQSFLERHQIPVPGALRRSQGRRVLIVDDEPPIRMLLTRTIKAAFPACTIELAENGFEAGTKIFTFLPDLVVLDLRLPGVHGYKVCQQIKSDKRAKHMKILAISGIPASEAGFRSRMEGADGFIPKPIDLEKFQSEVGRLLSIEPAARAGRSRSS